MRIADTQLEISVFVCVDEPGISLPVPRATAFLTVIKGDPFWTGYVVTASHVIEAAGERQTYLRVNTEDGFDDVKIERDEWFIHDRYDIAMVRVEWTGERPYKLYAIYPEQFVSASYSLQVLGAQRPVPGEGLLVPGETVRTGDQVSIIGLFIQHHGRSRSLPIARTGTIARMPSAPVKYKRPGGICSEQVAYLVEVHSHGGLSGSPVYVHRDVLGVEVINFLGVVSGHFDIDQTAATTGDIYGTVTVAINAGIAVVTPAEAVRELLWRDDVVRDRFEAVEAAKTARASGLQYVTPKKRAIIHHRTS